VESNLGFELLNNEDRWNFPDLPTDKFPVAQLHGTGSCVLPYYDFLNSMFTAFDKTILKHAPLVPLGMTLLRIKKALQTLFTFAAENQLPRIALLVTRYGGEEEDPLIILHFNALRHDLNDGSVVLDADFVLVPDKNLVHDSSLKLLMETKLWTQMLRQAPGLVRTIEGQTGQNLLHGAKTGCITC
jgi:hypothetical protein